MTNYKQNSGKRNKSEVRGRSNAKERKMDRKDCQRSDDLRKPGDINNPDYYVYDSNLRSQIGSISFNQFTGVPFVLAVSNGTGANFEVSVPSIMRVNLNPSAGVVEDKTYSSGVNLAALAMYTKLSANNAKTSNYAPQDLTTLIYAISEVICLSSHIARIFGVCRLYNLRNRSYPQKIVEALGCDYNDLIDRFANYRTQYNNLMVAASKIPVPANIALFQKSSELYNNVYLDMEGSPMAQTYVFVPNSTWYLDEAYNNNGTGLKTLDLGYDTGSTGKTTMGGLLTKLDLMISSLLNSTTLNAIYSDILRLSEKENMPLRGFTTISDDYTVVPVYNSEVRMWINNLQVMGSPTDVVIEGRTPSNDVVPSAGYNRIEYNPSFLLPVDITVNGVLNFDHANVTSDEVIEATRLAARWNGSFKHESATYMKRVTLPDHYVTSIVLFNHNESVVQDLAIAPAGKIDKLMWMSSGFDWSPFIYSYGADGSLKAFYGDTNYYTTIDYSFLKRLNDASYQGLLELR